MLEKITNTLSNQCRSKVLPVIATTLLVVPGCKSFQFSPSTGAKEPTPAAATQKRLDEKLYQKLFDYMEKQGIEVFVGGLIKDLQDIGEHTGVINFKNGNVEIKPAQANGKFNEHKEALKRLRQKKAAHQDRTILRNFLRERHDTADFFVDTLAELAEKNPGLGNYWADIFEAYVDAAGKFGECGDITYHFHPTPNPLSSVDLRTASINNFLPLALAYDNGGIMAFYLEKGKHKNKRFPVKDPEKKFQLDLLSSKVYAKKDFVLFNKKTKITQHTDCFGDALHYLKRAVEQYSAEAAAGKKDPKKEKQLGETVDFLNNNLIRKFKYLSETSKELWDSKGHQEAVGRYNAYAQELKGLLHAYKGAAPEKPKEKGRFPWEIPLGLAALATVGAGVYFSTRKLKDYQARRRAR